jgi:GNAT superfamily N-acetyltransferase
MSLRRLWQRRHPSEVHPFEYGDVVAFGWWETYSFDAPSIAEVGWLATRTGLRIACACLRFDEHADGTKVLTVLDLFVWPTYRRQGYGRQLLERLLARGQTRECSRVDVLCYDADNVHDDTRTLSFLRRADLAVTSHPIARVIHVGSKTLEAR